MKQFIQILLGNQTPAEFAALFFLSLLAAFVSLLLQTTSRNVNSPRTPIHFSWYFFLQDNFRRILGTLALIYLALRFTPELLSVQVTPFWAVAIGFSWDKLAQVVKDKTRLRVPPAAAAALLLFFLSGCATQQKAEKYYRKHPEQLALQCAEKYPVRDSLGALVIDTVHQADNQNHAGTIENLTRQVEYLEMALATASHAPAINSPEDLAGALRIRELQQLATTLRDSLSALQARYRPCRPDTAFRTQTVYRENTARVFSLQKEILDLQGQINLQEAQIEYLTSQRNKWRAWAWQGLGLSLLLGGALAYRILKK